MEKIFTVDEVAQMMRVSRYTVNRWIREKSLRAIRPKGTRQYLVAESDLLKLIRNDYKGGEKDGRR